MSPFSICVVNESFNHSVVGSVKGKENWKMSLEKVKKL